MAKSMPTINLNSCDFSFLLVSALIKSSLNGMARGPGVSNWKHGIQSRCSRLSIQTFQLCSFFARQPNITSCRTLEVQAYNVCNLMPMDQLQFLLSLTTDDNDYQREQLAAAEKTARELGVAVKTIHANNDVFEQSQQLLEIIQSSKRWRPHAIIVEPVSGTGLPRVAE